MNDDGRKPLLGAPAYSNRWTAWSPTGAESAHVLMIVASLVSEHVDVWDVDIELVTDGHLVLICRGESEYGFYVPRLGKAEQVSCCKARGRRAPRESSKAIKQQRVRDESKAKRYGTQDVPDYGDLLNYGTMKKPADPADPDEVKKALLGLDKMLKSMGRDGF